MPARPNFPARLLALACVPLALVAAQPGRAETFHHCTGFVDSLPAVITTQGTWCLRADVATAMSDGSAVLVSANNVTIDCNGFKIGGLSAGPDTSTYGIRANSRRNITIRNCHLRGFVAGVFLGGSAENGGHVVEDNRVDFSTLVGLWVFGDGSIIRRNHVLDTGGTSAYPAGIRTQYRTYVLDNVVSGVDGTLAPYYSNAFGISVNYPAGAVSGNLVGGFTRSSEGGIYGVYASNADEADGLIVAGNRIIGDGGTGSGVNCASHGIATGNSVVGLAYATVGCTDGGGNSHAP